MIAAGFANPSGAQADLRESVNWARMQGCSSKAQMPLRANSQLEAAAARMVGGQRLHEAVSSSGYAAVQSTAVHLSGDVSGPQVARLLAANYCRTLSDARFLDMGAVRRGQDVWVVFAAPYSVPSPRDAAAVTLQILGLVNAERAKGRRCGDRLYAAARPLTLNRALSSAALAHSTDMAEHLQFDHRGHDGSTPAARVTRAGFGDYSVVGENIAAGAMNPDEVTRGWLDSPAHCENIMDSRFTQIGIGYAVNLSSAELVYWTQNFAAAPSNVQRRH